MTDKKNVDWSDYLASPEHKAFLEELRITRLVYEDDVNTFWKNLSIDDQLKAFYAVVKRIHQGDYLESGSYRYVLYDIFQFGTDAYSLGMDCGYMDLHNAIDPDNSILKLYKIQDMIKKRQQEWEELARVSGKKVNGARAREDSTILEEIKKIVDNK